MKSFKRVMALALSANLIAGTALGANATGLRDIFDAKYYADQYKDLKEAFGYDEELLWQHFQEYGLEEGRIMSPILDVVSYREKYEDLDAAFGDNWDSYVDHYLQYGIDENRDNGTDFNVKEYINAYSDVKEAYGDDYAKVAEHYLVFGMDENRIKGNDSYVAMVAAQKAAAVAPSTKPSAPSVDDSVRPSLPDTGDQPAQEETEYGVYKYEYNENGDMTKLEYYDLDSNLKYYVVYERDENGQLTKDTTYDADGNMTSYGIYEYDVDGCAKRRTTYRANGSVSFISEYDESDRLIKSYSYREDGSYDLWEWPDKYTEKWYMGDAEGNCILYQIEEYDENGKLIRRTQNYYGEEKIYSVAENFFVSEDGWFRALSQVSYYENGNIWSISEGEMDETGTYVKTETCTHYNEDGTFFEKSVTTKQLINGQEHIVKRVSYDAAGILQGERESIYDAEGNGTQTVETSYHYKEEGTYIGKSIHTWIWLDDNTEGCIKFVSYDAEDKITYEDECTYDDAGEILTKIIVNYNYNEDGTLYCKTITNSKRINGNLCSIDSVSYNADGVKLSETVYTNVDGVETGRTCTRYDANGTVVAQDVYKFINGRYYMTSMVLYENGKAESKYEYVYDEAGNKVSDTCTYYRADGTVNYFGVFTYKMINNKECCIGREDSYSDGSSSKTVYTYDDNGAMLTDERVEYKEDGTINCSSKATYKVINGKDCCMERFSYFADGTLEATTVYSYDDTGVRLKEARTSAYDGSVWEYYFDANGYIVKRVYIDAQGVSTTYDANGNVIS